MAKALTVVLLLAATAAFAAAQAGKGVSISINKGAAAPADGGNSTAPAGGKGHPFEAIHSALGGGAAKHCQCKDECVEGMRKVCKVSTVDEEVCRNVKGEEDIVECATRCFKANKIVNIGKGRRLLSANAATIAPHILAGKGAILNKGTAAPAAGNGTSSGGDGGAQEICREICKPGKKPTTSKECKMVPKKKYDCKDESTGTKCVKKCKCAHGVTTESREVPALHIGKGH